jgi:hypothetical protein
MVKPALLCLLIFASTPALAIFKCESHDKIAYSDQPCPGGTPLNIVNAPPVDNAGIYQTAKEKAALRRLENERHKREAQDEKERLRTAHGVAMKQKRCATLARRMKWAQEDAAAAAGRSGDRAKRYARRAADHYEEECISKPMIAG